MARPPKPDRSAIAAVTRTFRLTRVEADALDKLVDLHNRRARTHGSLATTTSASIVQAVVREALMAEGLLADNSEEGLRRRLHALASEDSNIEQSLADVTKIDVRRLVSFRQGAELRTEELELLRAWLETKNRESSRGQVRPTRA